jgi:hypothetical protein
MLDPRVHREALASPACYQLVLAAPDFGPFFYPHRHWQ